MIPIWRHPYLGNFFLIVAGPWPEDHLRGWPKAGCCLLSFKFLWLWNCFKALDICLQIWFLWIPLGSIMSLLRKNLSKFRVYIHVWSMTLDLLEFYVTDHRLVNGPKWHKICNCPLIKKRVQCSHQHVYIHSPSHTVGGDLLNSFLMRLATFRVVWP